jgi:superfamily II DNA or RNA helicase
MAEIVVTTTASAPRLARVLAAGGRKVALWIADEAHRTECGSILEASSTLQAARCVGMTATPFRSKADEQLSLFGALVYEYGLGAAIRDGVLVEPRVIPYVGEEGVDGDDALIAMILDGAADGPGIVNAASIIDAEGFADRLSGVGIAAEAIHSGHDEVERGARLTRLRRGGLRALVHVNLLTEGADFPWLTWLGLRRSSAADVRFLQEVGRVLRCHPGKTHATVFDPHGLFETHNLERGASLAHARHCIAWV